MSTHTFNILIFFLLFAFNACSNRLSEVSIKSNLQEGDSISVAIYSQNEAQYITVNDAVVTSKDAIRGRVDIPLPDSLIKNIGALSFTIHCYSDSILTISSIRLKNYGVAYPRDIINSLWWQHGLMFEIDSDEKTIKSSINKNIPGIFPVGINVFFNPTNPVGFQLFLRISLLATLLVLALVLYKQASEQRFIIFTVAIFIASLPLKIDYTSYSKALMLIAIVVAFIRDKSRLFTWQPVFYILCAMYIMDIIGMTYTIDPYSGFKRLDRGILLVLFPLSFSMIQFTQKNVILVLRFFIWSVITFCAFALISYFTIVPEFTWNMVFRGSKTFAPLLTIWPAHWHPSFLSTIMLMAVPVSIYLRFQDEKQITFVEMALGILLPVAFTFLGGARVGMITVPVLLGVAYMFYCRFIPVIKWGLVVAGIVAGAILMHGFMKTENYFFDPVRVDLRKTAISAIKEKPVFGWGTGSSKQLIQSEERANKLEIQAPYEFNQFHNQYLEDMVQFGIPGIILLLTLLGWILWLGINEKKFLLLSFFAIYSIFCWTESILFVSKAVVPFIFWVCFLTGNKKNI